MRMLTISLLAQVDFGRAARALDHDEIVLTAQPIEARRHHGQEPALHRGVAAEIDPSPDRAAHDQLRVLVRFPA